MNESQTSTAKGGQGMLLLAAAAFASSATVRVADPLLPQIAEEFQTTVAAASVIATVYALAYGLCQLVHGPLGDRFGKVRMIVLMMALAGVATGVCALAGDLDSLLVLRLVAGASASAVIPLSMAHIGDTVAYERRQPVLARYLSGIILGALAGQALGGILGEWVGWRGVFLLLGVIYEILTVLLWWQLRKSGTGGGSRAVGVRTVVGGMARLAASPSARLVVGTVFVEGFLFYGGFTFVGAYLRARHGLGFDAIGAFLGAFAVGGMIYSLASPVILRRLKQQGMAVLAGILLAGAFLGLALDPPPWLVPLPILASGLGFYMMHNTLQTRATQMAPEMRGLAVSIFASLFFLGQAGGVLAAGHLILAGGYRMLFGAVGIALPLLAVNLARLLGR